MDHNDFRRASGLAAWQADQPPDTGPGLWEINGHDPSKRHITNLRRLAGTPRTPGAALITTAGWLLITLAAGLFYVSFTGQYSYIFTARHQETAAGIEAGMLDAGMIILSLLALGLAMAGKPARTERALILACSAGSAAMNYAAADTASPRSVIAYTAAPVFLAVITDRVIAVIRRHVRLDGETSPWAACGHAALTLTRLTGMAALYGLRFTLDCKETSRGLRRAVLQAAPLPQTPPDPTPADNHEDTAPLSKTAHFLQLYDNNPDGKTVTELAAAADITPGYARVILSRRAK